MKVSREYAIAELEGVRKTLSGWIKDLQKPTRLSEDGKSEEPCYGDEGPPKGLSVESVEGIPADQFRAEVLAMAGKLAALADAG